MCVSDSYVKETINLITIPDTVYIYTINVTVRIIEVENVGTINVLTSAQCSITEHVTQILQRKWE